jgi:NADPH2:quinone reductase
MQAWRVSSLGEPEDVMAIEQVPVPRPGPGEVVVQVGSAAINFPDALLARGQYQDRPPLPFTPGIELCGEIVEVGPGVDPYRVGERVIGTPLLPHGALASYALARAVEVLPAPVELGDAEASAFQIAYQTGWFGLYRRAALRVGETLVVTAAAGGVGSAALQLGKAAGARIVAVVGSQEKAEVARRLGADLVLDRTVDDVVEGVKSFTSGKGADVVYEVVGGDSFAAATRYVGFEGRIVVVGFAGGEIPQAATNHLLVKNYSVVGLHWGLYRMLRPELVRRAHADLEGLVAAGALRPLVSARLEFGAAAKGIAQVAAGATVGRLTVGPP